MIDACTSCGAPAPATSDGLKFVCEFCKAKNVDEEYFKRYAASIDSGKGSRLFQLGISSYVSGDYVESQKHLQASVVEDDSNAEAWLYLALCMAATAKPSNFEKNFSAAREYSSKAKSRALSPEAASLGSIDLANRFLKSGIPAALHYFDTGVKKYVAFGEDRSAANMAAAEFEKGFVLLVGTLNLQPNNSALLAKASVLGLSQCLDAERMKASVANLSEYKQRFASIAAGVSMLQDKLTDAAIEERASIKKQLGKLIGDAKQKLGKGGARVEENVTVASAPPPSRQGPSAPKPSQSEPGAGTSSSMPIAAEPRMHDSVANAPTASVHAPGASSTPVWLIAVVVGVVVLGAAGFFAYSSIKERQAAEQPAKEVEARLLEEQKRVAEERQARESEKRQREEQEKRQSAERAQMEVRLREQEERARQGQQAQPAAPPPSTSPAPLQQTQPSSAQALWGPATSIVVEILKAASGSNWNVVDQRVAQLKSQPPAIPIGDRRSSRRANDEGLQALRRGDLTTAVRALEQAVSADERDFEVRNNLGHAYYRAGRLPESENSLLRVLTLAPDRTSAWANLSQTVADQGNRGASIAALRLAVRHSANREKTLDYLNQTAATSSSVPYKDVIAVVLREVDSIPRSPGDLSGPAPADAARRAAKQGVTEPTPASASNQNPVASAPAGSAQTTTRRDPRELCKNKSNFLSRAICESRLCARDEDLRDHPYCVELRAKEAQSGRQ